MLSSEVPQSYYRREMVNCHNLHDHFRPAQSPVSGIAGSIGGLEMGPTLTNSSQDSQGYDQEWCWGKCIWCKQHLHPVVECPRFLMRESATHQHCISTQVDNQITRNWEEEDLESDSDEEWESWDEIPVLLYEESDYQEIESDEIFECYDVDPYINELLDKDQEHYQTTWVEEEFDYPLEEIIIEGSRYGVQYYEEHKIGECRNMSDIPRMGVGETPMISSEIPGDFPMKDNGVYEAENRDTRREVERTRNEHFHCKSEGNGDIQALDLVLKNRNTSWVIGQKGEDQPGTTSVIPVGVFMENDRFQNHRLGKEITQGHSNDNPGVVPWEDQHDYAIFGEIAIIPEPIVVTKCQNKRQLKSTQLSLNHLRQNEDIWLEPGTENGCECQEVTNDDLRGFPAKNKGTGEREGIG